MQLWVADVNWEIKLVGIHLDDPIQAKYRRDRERINSLFNHRRAMNPACIAPKWAKEIRPAIQRYWDYKFQIWLFKYLLRTKKSSEERCSTMTLLLFDTELSLLSFPILLDPTGSFTALVNTESGRPQSLLRALAFQSAWFSLNQVISFPSSQNLPRKTSKYIAVPA